MSLPRIFGNMSRSYNPAAAEVWHQPPAGKEPEPEPTEPDHVPHGEDSKTHQEILIALAPLREAMQGMIATGSMMAQVAEKVAQIYAAPIYERVFLSLTNHPYVVEDRHRNHVALFVAASETITLNVPGIGTAISFNLNAGWNQVDFPPMTEIGTSSAGGFNVLVLYSMDRIANA